ncbi:MAG TPA: hypothetical protein VGN17_05180 [Bryobacteraceae bacterium]|jgi:hypothetical protein
MQFDINTVMAIFSVLGALAAWAVIPYRLDRVEKRQDALDRRLDEAEDKMVNHRESQIRSETKLDMICSDVAKINVKLDGLR